MRLSDLELEVIDAVNDIDSFKNSMSHICESYLNQHPRGGKTAKGPRIFGKKIVIYKATHCLQEKAETLLNAIQAITTDDELKDFLFENRKRVSEGYYGVKHFSHYIDRVQRALGINNEAFAEELSDRIVNSMCSAGF